MMSLNSNIKEYTLEFKDWNKTRKAKQIVIECGGEVTHGFQCYCYYCISYLATEEQDAEIVRRLKDLGWL